MNYYRLRKWTLGNLSIGKRLTTICICYLIFLMISVRKHTLKEAARLSGIDKSQFSRFLNNHYREAAYNLDSLSKKQARQFSRICKVLKKGSLPWKVAIIVDATIQKRTSLHSENVKKFNHGKGYVIGHQWTNIVLAIAGAVIPLPPIAFYSKKYCRDNGLEYKTENQLVVEYIDSLNMDDYIRPHKPQEIVFLADSGYDSREIEQAVVRKKWNFIIALKKTRSVKSKRKEANSPKSKGWSQVSQFFKNHRWAKWQTIRVQTNGRKRKRMEFRIRQIIGHLRYVCDVQLICSEFKKRPNGRRKYLACSDLKVKPRLIIIGYRLRWLIEIFHKQVKMFLGFQDVSTKRYRSIISHVYWVYCAYILLNSHPPGIPADVKSLVEKQSWVEKIVSTKETNRVIQLLTQFNGPQRYREELQRSVMANQS